MASTYSVHHTDVTSYTTRTQYSTTTSPSLVDTIGSHTAKTLSHFFTGAGERLFPNSAPGIQIAQYAIDRNIDADVAARSVHTTSKVAYDPVYTDYYTYHTDTQPPTYNPYTQ